MPPVNLNRTNKSGKIEINSFSGGRPHRSVSISHSFHLDEEAICLLLFRCNWHTLTVWAISLVGTN